MDIAIHRPSTFLSFPYEELQAAFNLFEFRDQEMYGHGQIKKRTSGGRSKYGVVMLTIRKTEYAHSFSWNVYENQIPVVFLDTVLSTIKTIAKDKRGGLHFTITGGEYDPIDSSAISFEMATFMAIADIIGFDHDRINIYKIQK